MSDKSDILNLYENLEGNKQSYTDEIKAFISEIDSCISSKDIKALNSVFEKSLSDKNEKTSPLVFSSSTFRLQSIKEAMNSEYAAGLSPFWDDVSDSGQLLAKYSRTIFMIRRLNSDLPDGYKQEAHSYLENISPYIINAAFSDPTVWVGRPDYIYFILASDFMQKQRYDYSLLYLQFVDNKNNDVLFLLDQLKKLIRKQH